MTHPTLEKISKTGKGATFHLGERGDYLTRCGINREDWVVIERAELTTDLDDPSLCKRCRSAILR